MTRPYRVVHRLGVTQPRAAVRQSRFGDGSGHAAVTLRSDEIEAAMARVGRTAGIRSRWLLTFAARDLKTLTPRARRIVQMEVDFFVVSENIGRSPRVPGGLAAIRFPAEEFAKHPPMIEDRQIRRWHRWLRGGIAKLVRGEVWRISVAMMHQLGVGSFLSLGITRSIDDIFKIGTVEAFKHEWSRFRLCERCRAAFIGQKRQSYCTSRCSQAMRTRRYRTRNAERVRVLRRANYERKQRVKHGAKVRVGRHAHGSSKTL